ncbi:hypothetical protein ABL78_1473 [Leptomonas seymouri]|uniref:Uncharacterized protein n=1 Tax=Leptomonas seymouri TaxID=5684 RepID=A0A0N0P8E7_LEPSE|nr:hypothetical protein ABL78_1473 [Leptomonas seymouri]|eukprot:KPI89437.1 hypothetical protein ABL78_1473 [Leptomonas seymouri]
MSSNYFAFSTDPGAHALGAPVTGMLGHPSGHNNNSSGANGMVDSMLPQHGVGLPGGMLSGANGGGMLPYAGPPSQSRQPPPTQPQQQRPPPQQRPSQQQSHFMTNSILNSGSTVIPPSSLWLSANNLSVGGNGTGSAGGPAVPAPRSTATLIAEATGAPPPPPAPSRNALIGNANPQPPPQPSQTSTATIAASGGVMALGNCVSSQSLNAVSPPTPPVGISAPIGVAAAAASGVTGVGGAAVSRGGAVSPVAVENTSSFATSFMSPSFKAFTTSAATMLSTQGAAAASRMDNVSTAAVEGAAALLETVHSGRCSPPAATSAAVPVATGLSPFGHVEVQCTLPTRERGDTGMNESGLDPWYPTQDIEDELGQLGYIFACLSNLDDDGIPGCTTVSTANMDEGNNHHLDLFYNSNLRVAAAKVCKLIEENRHDTSKLRLTFREVTLAVISGGVYKVILYLPRLEAVTLRYSVVKYLLESLVHDHRREMDVEKPAKDFASLVDLGLVSAAGFAAVVDTFLSHEAMVPVALRLLTFGLGSVDMGKTVREALEAVPRIAQQLHELYAHSPQYEVDVALITRLWQREKPLLFGSLQLQTTFSSNDCPVTCMSYFGVRDELITGHMNGSVVLWGAPQMVREKSRGSSFSLSRPIIRPRGVVPLPLDCVPVGMAGQRIDGQYLAIASMPYKSRKPYLRFCATGEAKAPTGSKAADTADSNNASTSADSNSTQSTYRREASNGAGVGAIIVITCNENSIRWNKGEVIMRPAGVALTAITAFRNSIVAVGESMVQWATPSAAAVAAAAVASPHRLSFVDVAGGTVMRQIPKAHDDYITALNVLDDGSYVLLSGGRDAAVKLWDPRSREDTPVVNTALCTGVPTHNSTITAMCTMGYNIVSTAVDGSMLVWDLRSMEAPRVRHELAYPIVDVALLGGKHAVTATSRGLITVSLDTLEPLDMRSCNTGYSHVIANNTGELLFTAACSGPLHAVAVRE